MGILRSSSSTIRVTFYSGETPVDAGAVTVRVNRDNGDLLRATTPATPGTTGVYTFALTTADTAQLDILKATWTSPTLGERVTHHEVVGNTYVAVAEVRALPKLNDVVKYPLAVIEDALRSAEALIERYTGVAFVRRYRRESVDTMAYSVEVSVSGHPVRKVLSADYDGVSQTVATWLVFDHGAIGLPQGYHFPNGSLVNVAYEYGYDTPPEDLKRAVLMLVRAWLLEDQSRIPDRSTGTRNEFGDVTWSVINNREHPTGIPEVDAILVGYKRNRIRVT